MSEEAVAAKARKWTAMQNRRFNKKKTVSNPVYVEMPPEALRKICKDRGARLPDGRSCMKAVWTQQPKKAS